ncbi:MAG TPA: Holliday junction DNA helicase RuvB C-terminal domain-containing protein [Phycisphaerae bacterium]|nr:Holliday junction DNA helicase RuvB C-terminal domain-containing protein [Phycisphaerae bacterium]HRY71559.1 Holliday junction DNA helicase RuvB C-terminal domain-containing protein [Phycisphaerae bacterium]HSA25680.1 Holliday junction DNA helicase RuvB C-terminal domain-containing protein [Phycisphaerae bacterium]
MAKSLRPQTLDEMIGQEAVKQKARIAIGAAMQRGEPLPHVLQTSSGGGLGKTCFARILANEMFSPLVETSGPCVASVADLRRILVQLEPGSLLHIDEAHAIGRPAAEELLLVLEEGVLNLKLDGTALRLPLPRFTLVCSTTKPSSIGAPLRQRFGLHFHFEFYPSEELTLIARRMSEALRMPFADGVCEAIAERGLGIPRLCLRLAERVRDVTQARNKTTATMTEFEIAMGMEGIDPKGLGPQHRHLLSCLASARRPLSARSLALALGAELSTVTDVLEPPLVRLGLMMVGPGGRLITDPGRRHLQRAMSEHSANISSALGVLSGSIEDETQR